MSDALGLSPVSRKRERNQSQQEAKAAVEAASVAKQKAEELRASVRILDEETHQKMMSAWSKIVEIRRSGKRLGKSSPFGTNGKLTQHFQGRCSFWSQ